MILFAIFVLCLGDIVLNYSDLFGGSIFVIVNILLTYNYVVEDRPDRMQLLVWILLSLLSVFAIVKVPGEFDLSRGLAIIYAISGLALVCSSYVFPGRTFRGSLLLFVSGVFWIINKLIGFDVRLYVISFFCFYIAAITLASSGSAHAKNRRASRKNDDASKQETAD